MPVARSASSLAPHRRSALAIGAALLLVPPLHAHAQVVLLHYGATGYRYQVTSTPLPPIGTTLVPYGSNTYRYMITADPPPPDIVSPLFDDSSLPLGSAPFSNGSGTGIYTPATYWPAHTTLITRLRFFVGDPTRRTTLRFGVDNDVAIYINGVLVASASHGFAAYDDYTLYIPSGVLTSGENVLVAIAVDRGGGTAFDVSVTVGVEYMDFDDSSYAVGASPFSNGSGAGIYTPNTYWPENTALVARRRFFVAGVPVNAVLRFGVDNDATVFVNGALVTSVTHEGVASYNDFVVALPDGLLTPGDNLIVVLAKDRGGGTALDMSITADYAVPLVSSTFARLKALYRQ